MNDETKANPNSIEKELANFSDVLAIVLLLLELTLILSVLWGGR
jgi:hypothetical protein